MPYESPRGEHRFADVERQILRYWKEQRVFERSLRAREGGPPFVFYEGPPTANGLPHNGHVLTRVIKDLFPRYRAMRGFDVPRRAGWDTHGLPVEVEVEKELGIHGKKAIEEYGVEPFTRRCIESVFRYTDEWERMTEKIGFWLDTDEAYVTYHRAYVESVWWALRVLFDRGLLYRGRKSVWWWPQGGTALSAAEVGLGYRTVDDPAVVVRFKSRSRDGVSYLAWTTTPWTLPSNVTLAVNEQMDYAVAEVDRGAGPEKVIVAQALVQSVLGEDATIVSTVKGAELVGETFEPLFRYAEPEGGKAYEIIPADFVGADQGTGIVHIAPGFGEDDFRACQQQGVGFLQLLEPSGHFPPEATDVAGMYFKDADKVIVRLLKERGLLFDQSSYRHDYPFCWRASSDPLIQYARPAWFIRTTDLIDRAIATNQKINWLPSHIKDGRFGDFLDNNVDWALSRERFWGTPLPIWHCTACGHETAIDHLDAAVDRNPDALAHWHEALKKDPGLSEHLVVHKPWIDEVTFACEKCDSTMKRVPEVIDCWFDSGCMPFAQVGFPHKGRDEFRGAFPADFISEAIDQTRGWFYSLLMISNLIFDEKTCTEYGLKLAPGEPHPYKTCIVLGHVCDPDGRKESKSSGNYTPPDLVLEGRFKLTVADAARLEATPASDGAMLLPSQVKTLGLPAGCKLALRSSADPDRTFDAVLEAGAVGKEQIGLGVDVLGALGAKAGDDVWVEVLDDPPGADAFRWFFYSSGPPWNNTRNSLRAIRDQQNEFLVRWSNVLSFFLIYAAIDAFDPAEETVSGDGLPDWRSSASYRRVEQRPLMDRWILGELALTGRRVEQALDRYEIYEAASALNAFVDGLSNWYVRRNRDRFWAPGVEQDKRDALWTLWEALVELSRLAAPFVPFFADHVWRTLIVGAWPQLKIDSVHLANWPELPSEWIDEALSESMDLAREIVSLGLSARATQKVRVRQPLRKARLMLADPAQAARLDPLAEIVQDELNVKTLEFEQDADPYVHWRMQPNFRAIGPKYGKLVPKIKKHLGQSDVSDLRRRLDADGLLKLEIDGQPVELTAEEVNITLSARDHYAAGSSARAVVVIETDLDDALVREGLANELVNRIQALRKEAELDYTDRIRVRVDGPPWIEKTLSDFGSSIAEETLAVEVQTGAVAEFAHVKQTQIQGEPATIGLSKV